MEKAKYIVVKDELGTESMIIFNVVLVHNMVAKPFAKVVSGGFIQFVSEDDKVIPYCYGESISLGIKSRPLTDNAIARYMINDD